MVARSCEEVRFEPDRVKDVIGSEVLGDHGVFRRCRMDFRQRRTDGTGEIRIDIATEQNLLP